MEVRFLKRTAVAFALALCILPTLAPAAFAQGNVEASKTAQTSKEAATVSPWTSARSEHFLVIGDAGGEELRAAAMRLERYRAAFARLRLGTDDADATRPTRVFIFRDDSSYNPFKPVYRGQRDDGVSGYFQAGSEVDYITLSLDDERAADSSSPLVHEYVHLLIKNTYRAAPLWFKEGLAEYYSTAIVSGDNRKATLGKPIKDRLRLIQGRALLPLAALFAVDDHSPFYHEQGKRSLFYAQSWALVHYLLQGRNVERRAQLSLYLELLATGTPVEDGFRKAFQIELADLESELTAYIRSGKFRDRVEMLGAPAESVVAPRIRSLSEAEALGYLGDLLLRTDRREEAESQLQRALALDASSPGVRVSLGILRVRQNRFAEAAQLLRQALDTEPGNHLAHYYYAETLYREGPVTDDTVKGFEERTRAIRDELNVAIELAPKFTEAYRLLALVELERGGQLDEAEALLKRALALAPERYELSFLMAQLQLRRGEFDAARKFAQARSSQGRHWQTSAEKLLETIAAREKQADERRKAQQDALLAEEEARAAALPCDMPDPGPQFKKTRFAGEQLCGRLTRIECEGTSVVLFVESHDRTFRLSSAALNRIRFITYTSEVKTGQLNCGQREPSNPVLVTYRQKKDGGGESDGEAVAVEFVPPDWKH